MKKLCGAFLCLFLLLGAVLLTALPARAATEGDFDYENYTDNGAVYSMITGYHGAGGDVEIPSALGSRPVRMIGPEVFYDNDSLTGVTIPKSVTRICVDAFAGCSAISRVDISDLAAWCGIVFENSDANPLHYLRFYPSGEEGGFYLNGEALTELEIPAGVTRIGDYAFYGFRDLTGVTIPEGVTSIGSCAFYGCSGLTGVAIPKSVTSIGLHAFMGCTGLKRVDISDLSVWCMIDFEDGVTSPLSYAKHLYLDGEELTALEIPSGVTHIGDNAFSNCRSLTSVVIPVGVTRIGEYAFNRCSGLTSVAIPEGVTAIGGGAFSYCSLLTSAAIPEGVTRIDYNTFSCCSLLSYVMIPESVTWINVQAFNYCGLLRDVYYAGTAEQWNNISIYSEGNGPLTEAAIHYGCPALCVKAQPVSVTTTVSSKASFTVIAVGTGTLQYQWQYSTNGTAWANTTLAGYNTPTLTITAAAALSGRQYRCVITDQLGSVTSDAAKLTVKEGPVIKTHPANQTVTAGTKTSFTVSAIGTGTLTYRWQWSSDGTTWANASLSGYNTNTLTFTAGDAVNGRYYRCVVSDSKGSITSNAAKLTVVPGPAITGQPGDASVTAGSKATFTVKATGSGTLTYRWQYSVNGTTWMNTTLAGYNTKTLTITASTAINGRYYRCVVSDNEGTAYSAAAKLTVVSGPVITRQPQDAGVTAGSKATFTVAATGTGTLSYRWQWSPDGTTWANTTLTGYNTNTLTVKASAAVDGRYYRCVVTDSNGSAYSDAAKLTVVPGPTITGQPKAVSVNAGGKAAFTVTATGTGTLTYQWQYSVNGTTWYNTSLTGYNTKTLTVTASAAVNGRYYRCVVTDSKGSAASEGAKLTVIPGPVITKQPASVTVSTGSKASFSVAATGSGTLTYRWQWSPDGKSWANTTLTGYNTPTLTITASSTVNGRYYRCVVTDADGSNTSEAAKLTVTSVVITGQPGNQTVAAGSKAAFTVKATGSGTLTYRWQWSPDGTTWANTSLTGYNTATLTITASSAVNGRYYRCVVTDANGSAVSAAAKLTVTA